MKKYNLKNQVHFITINTYKKYWLFKKENLCQIVIDNLNFYRRKFSFKLLGYVIMPNHLHLLIQLNKKYNDISKVMRDFKKFTSVQIIKQLIKENEKDLLKTFSMTGKIFNYPSTLGTARSSDRASLSAESEDSAYPTSFRKKRKYSVWMNDFYDFNIYSENLLLWVLPDPQIGLVSKKFIYMKKINKLIFKKLYQPPKNSHKGDNGVLLILAGSKKYHGAPWYAIEAASKIVDLIYFHSDPMAMRLMEEIKKKTPSFIVVSKKELSKTIQKSDCLLIGPGWGKNEANKKLINNLLKKHKNKKFVLDADALALVNLKQLNKNILITPHSSEFKKLFNIKANQENLKKMAKKYRVNILLKGKKDIICSPQACFFNTRGNQGMTKGGTGDVLAGLISALACKNDLLTATKAGCLVNGLAGDKLYKKYKVYYNARDLIKEIPKILK